MIQREKCHSPSREHNRALRHACWCIGTLALLIVFASCTKPRASKKKSSADDISSSGTDGNGSAGDSDVPSNSGNDSTETNADSIQVGEDAVADSGTPKTPICETADVEVTVEFAPPNILLVVDRSGSMGGTKWTQTKASIKKVLQDLGNQVSVGILMYPETKSCTVPNAPQVTMGPGQALLIEAAMNEAGTGGSTPMGKAMTVARQWLMTQDGTNETAVILAADGKPSDICLDDCTGCDCTDPSACFLCADLIECTYNNVKNQVAQLLENGIKTYVVGFEGGFGASDFLSALASSGGTANAGESPFYDAKDGSALADALTQIAGTVETCKTVVTPPETYDYVVVTVNGIPVPKDKEHINGWDMMNGNTVRLYGTACSDASAPGADVAVTFVCKKS